MKLALSPPSLRFSFLRIGQKKQRSKGVPSLEWLVAVSNGLGVLLERPYLPLAPALTGVALMTLAMETEPERSALSDFFIVCQVLLRLVIPHGQSLPGLFV